MPNSETSPEDYIPLGGRVATGPPPRHDRCESCGLSAEETGPYLDAEGAAPSNPRDAAPEDFRSAAPPLPPEDHTRLEVLCEKLSGDPGAEVTEEERRLLLWDQMTKTVSVVWVCQTCLSMSDEAYSQPEEEKARRVRLAGETRPRAARTSSSVKGRSEAA